MNFIKEHFIFFVICFIGLNIMSIPLYFFIDWYIITIGTQLVALISSYFIVNVYLHYEPKNKDKKRSK